MDICNDSETTLIAKMHAADDIAELVEYYVPELDFNNTRTKRNIFAWLGKNLFGLASHSDVQRITHVVEHLYNDQSDSLEEFEALRQDTMSFMKLASERMDHILANVQALYKRLHATQKALVQRTTANAQLMIYSAAVIAKIIDRMSVSENQVDRFSEGIRDLIRGQLNPSLVPHRILRATITKLQDKLRCDYSVFHLTETDLQYYYRYM